MAVRYFLSLGIAVAISLLSFSNLHAQGKSDSLLVNKATNYTSELAEPPVNDSIADLQYLEYSYVENKKERKRLVHFLKRIAHSDNDKHTFSPAFYYRLANTYARLKLYPQAMKYYYYSNPLLQKTISSQDLLANDTSNIADTSELAEESQAYLSSNYATGNLPEISFTKEDTSFTGLEVLQGRSKPIRGTDIIRPFKNHQAGIAFAVIVHIKQPEAGSRTAFSGLNNVGHTFITLIKYNEDQTYVFRSFGFYPQKSFPLEGSPFHPNAPATYKDDSKHDWDESVGKFVSRQQFFKILRLIRQYNRRHYNLNKNNCTDFGLCIAGMAGIQINATHGNWPLGSGNNPASAGQSVLEGKVINLDTDDQNGLFISANDIIK